MTHAVTLSIVVPALDEADGIVAHLDALAPLRAQGVEVIVVDGGSADATVALATPCADRVIASPRGRGAQMNAGAAVARASRLLFLHADTTLPPGAVAAVHAALDSGHAWGRFDVRIIGRPWMLRVVAGAMNLRSRLTGIATGDQAIFVTRAAFDAAGGWPEIALMEDIALSTALRQASRPACLRLRVTTSGRRWETRGVWRTIVLMWRLRFAWWRGVAPEVLAKRYR
ncbi:MAG: TIGR04283 family arsenosugar biosynthesis glycosyltransferase [Burkholderiales bacterium]|nr:TIGR04283 family arsenosugar biosynthesis glycosyltransferase [Burkholderiales bacterium]